MRDFAKVRARYVLTHSMKIKKHLFFAVLIRDAYKKRDIAHR